MKCLSLWQPWASLIAYEFKGVETRDEYARKWRDYRAPLLIHAAKHFERAAWMDMRATWPALQKMPESLPRGAIVACVNVVDVKVMTQAWIDQQTALELDLGGWVERRVGLVLEDVVPLPEPVPCVGRQGMFNVRPVDVGDRFYDVLSRAWDQCASKKVVKS